MKARNKGRKAENMEKYSKALINFTACLLFDNPPDHMTIEDAAYNIECWRQEKIKLPRDITPEKLAACYNSMVD